MVNKMPIISWEEIQKRRRNNQQEEKKKLEEKEVIFDIDLIHLSMDIEDWFFTLPVRFSPDEYQQLCDARDKWEQTDEWINRDSDMDEEYFLLKYCPNILDKVRVTLKDYCIKYYPEEVINELDQADIYANI